MRAEARTIRACRSFNAAGPCRAESDYMLPALRRLPTAHALIAAGEYSVLHAPQVGEMTALLSIVHELMQSGEYIVVALSCGRTSHVFGA